MVVGCEYRQRATIIRRLASAIRTNKVVGVVDTHAYIHSTKLIRRLQEKQRSLPIDCLIPRLFIGIYQSQNPAWWRHNRSPHCLIGVCCCRERDPTTQVSVGEIEKFEPSLPNKACPNVARQHRHVALRDDGHSLLPSPGLCITRSTAL